MEKFSLIIFQKDCTGCHACEVACKMEHELGVGPRLIKVIERTPSFFPIYCHHCSKPPCKEACPAEAISRDDRGIVSINAELCIGCKECITVCPFGAIQFDEESEVAVKCDLCFERIKNNEQPMCSKACPTRCIRWGDVNRICEDIELRQLLQEC